MQNVNDFRDSNKTHLSFSRIIRGNPERDVIISGVRSFIEPLSYSCESNRVNVSLGGLLNLG